MAYGRKSLQMIEQCHPDLQKVAHEAQRIANSLHGWDLTVTEGHRDKETQNSKYPRFSKVQWPNSKHNKTPSDAIHIQRYPIEWPQEDEPKRLWMKKYAYFYMTAVIVLIAAQNVGVEIRWGGDWDRDGDITDQDFDDLAHFERYKAQ